MGYMGYFGSVGYIGCIGYLGYVGYMRYTEYGYAGLRISNGLKLREDPILWAGFGVLGCGSWVN